MLYSINFWHARNSRLTQRETNHYITCCASKLAWPYLAGSSPGQLVIDRPFCTASAICLMLSIVYECWVFYHLWYNKLYLKLLWFFTCLFGEGKSATISKLIRSYIVFALVLFNANDRKGRRENFVIWLTIEWIDCKKEMVRFY